MPDNVPPRAREGFSESGSGQKSWGLTSSDSLTSLGFMSSPTGALLSARDNVRSNGSSGSNGSAQEAAIASAREKMLKGIDVAGLAGYVPRLLLSQLTEKTAIAFKQIDFKAAALFIDVCGFTRITEELRRSVDGSNSIADHLNNFFVLLLDIIAEFGGDVMQFSGDAILATWKAEDDADLHSVASLAASCASRLVIETASQTIQFSPRDPAIRLGVHIALGVGDVEFAIVGGVHDSWKYMTAGEGIRQAVVIADIAKMDEIVLSNTAKEILGEKSVVTVSVPGQPFKVHRLVSVINPVLPRSIQNKETMEALIPTDPAEESVLKQRIYKFLCDTVVNTWGRPGELRTVSTIFIRILGDPEKDLASVVQTSLTAIQVELATRDGVLNKVLYDDKGVVLLCVFGLPGHAHEDDAIRALAFSWSIFCKFESVCSLAFGISRSKAYCGYCGSSSRREYTVLGDGINLAARVMQHASTEVSKRTFCDGPVCTIFTDDVTQQLCASMFRFEGGAEVALKGKLAGSKVWEVVDGNNRISKQRRPPMFPSPSRTDTGNSSNSSIGQRNGKRGKRRHEVSMDELEFDEYESLSGSTDQRQAEQIFGRDLQLRAVLDSVWGIKGAGVMGMTTPSATHPSHRAVSIYGDAAMGKSVMLRKISEDASHRGVTVICSQGLQLDKDVPYSCLQVLLSGLARRPLAWFCVDIDATDPGLRPLLNTIVPNLSLMETEESAALTDSERADALQDIATGLIKRAYDGAVLICIDDAHWADPETLSVVTHILRTLENVGVIVTQRSEDSVPMGQGVIRPAPKSMSKSRDLEDWGGSNAFFKDGPVMEVVLCPLDKSATASLFRKVLGCPVDELIVNIVHAKSGGNPGFAEQILVALVDQENSPIVIADRARFAPGVDTTKITLPDGIEGVITGRVDRLPPQHQHYLKVASVIGPTFSLELLSKILKEASVPALREVFSLLEDTGFVTMLKSEYETKGKTATTQPSRRTRQGRSSVISMGSRVSKPTSAAGTTPLGMVYTFKLHLIVDVLYGMLLKKERRLFHTLVAAEIEAESSQTNNFDLPTLIHHYTSAGAHNRALHYLSKAVDESLSKGKAMDATRFALLALTIHDETDQTSTRLRWLAGLCQSMYQAGDFEGACVNALDVLHACREQPPVGCGLPMFIGYQRCKLWMGSSFEGAPHPHAVELLQAYYTLAIVSYHNDDALLAVYYSLKGLEVSHGVDENLPHLRGKRGMLYMLQKLPALAVKTASSTIVSTAKAAKAKFPSDKVSINRMSALMLMGIGAVKQAEQNLRHRFKGDVDLPILQAMHVSVAVLKALTGKPSEANRRLLSCSKTAHSVQDKRMEAYSVLLSVFIECTLIGDTGKAQTGSDKINKTSTLALSNGGTIWSDKKLAALRVAVKALACLREEDVQNACRLGFESSLRHAEIRKTVPSVITVISLMSTLEVLLAVPVVELVKLEQSEEEHQKQVSFLLSLLRAYSNHLVWARPLYSLYLGQHEAFRGKKSSALTILHKCYTESQIYSMFLVSGHALSFTATQLSSPEARPAIFTQAHMQYTNAGVSEHLQGAYKVPIG